MLRLPKMDHITPPTLSEACALMSEHGGKAKILAGGTDLLVACKLGNLAPSVLVSLGRIPELKGIAFDEKKGLHIGAMTSLIELRSHPVVIKHYPALAKAAAAVGARQLQYMGTLGGNLCLDTRCMYYNQSVSWRRARAVCLKMGGEVCHAVSNIKKCYAVFSGDLAPALIALNAKIKLMTDKGERRISLSEFYSGDGKKPIQIRPGEILRQVQIPPPAAGQRSTYVKYRIRGAIDFPLSAVAVRLVLTEKGICQDCTVVVNAVSSAPRQVPELIDLLKDKFLSEDLINRAALKASSAAHPVANTFGASPSYRRKMIEIMTRRTLKGFVQNPAVA